MYKIDWNNYLSNKRYRESKFQKEHELAAEKTDSRNDFESDLGRVSFSSALRRMHDKTQVLPLSSGDNVHTRLTHSIEVMNIAYSLGIDLCRSKEFKDCYGDEAFELERKIPVILKTAALVHDIGNPPFGHFGEEIIKDYFKSYFETKKKLEAEELIEPEKQIDFTNFDGNAEGFRILTRLQYLGELSGLNLTYATLGAYCKYPNLGQGIKKDYIGKKKHGVFTSEADVFKGMVTACHLRVSDNKIKRHPLSFLTEAADSISYSVMDIEDGFSLGWYSFKDICDFLNTELARKGLDIYTVLNLDKVDLSKYDDRKNMCTFRIKTIQYLVNLAKDNFVLHLEEIDKGDYNLELIEDDKNGLEEALKKFSYVYIFPQRQVEQVELTGRSVINGLLDIMIDILHDENDKMRNHLKSVMSKTFLKVALHEEDNNVARTEYKNYDTKKLLDCNLKDFSEYTKLRMVVDLISGMTDKYAVTLYQKLSGQKL